MFLHAVIFSSVLFSGDYLRNGMTTRAQFLLFVAIASLLLFILYYFLYPDKWRKPLFIIEGNDLIVTPFRINADKKSKIISIRENNKLTYEIVFSNSIPISFDLRRISKKDRLIVQSFIYNNYGDKIISNK
jgi:hypothetical protein